MDYHTLNEPQNQMEPAREDQVQNDAGGYVFQITPKQLLDRFLMLGTLKGTYYVTAKELTTRNLDVIKQLIEDDYQYVLSRVIEISQAGRAPKNDPALYVFAMLASSKNATYVLPHLDKIARTATHLFKFLNYVQSMRGWGRALKGWVGEWYVRKNDHQLLYQVLKYRSREGWSHRDVLRKAHPAPSNEFQNALFKWVTSGETSDILYANNLFYGYELVNKDTLLDNVVAGIRDYRLTREMVPTQYLKEPAVMAALLQDMPPTALLRNLANMAGIGLLVPGNWEIIDSVCQELENEEALQKARIHPLSVYQALRIYESGRNRNYRWEPVGRVVEALNKAFYNSFKYVESSNKRYLVATDVSGSMSQATTMEGIDARDAAAVMMMSLIHSEPQVLPTRFHNEISTLPIHRDMDLSHVIDIMHEWDWSDTDCALPMLYALKNKIKVDVFVIFTDNETWSGTIHPFKALQTYRKQMEIDAKLVVCAMTSTGFSIADPNDAGMLDIVGLDSNVPTLIAEFVK